MTQESQAELIDKLVKVTVAMTELLMLVEKDKFALNLFEESLKTTGALPVSLDDFIAEWQTVVNNATLDRLALYNCWVNSAKFYKDLDKEQICIGHLDDMNLTPFDIVFEDNSYMCIIVTRVGNVFKLTFSVPLSNTEEEFDSFDTACDYLWNNHSKEGYGV